MPTFDSEMKRTTATIERGSTVEYLNPTGMQSWEWPSKDLCSWCGSKWTPEGCFCRYCDSCSAYWKDSVRHDYSDGRPCMQVCPDCVKEGF